MTTGTFLEGHEQGIIDTANECNVNPYYIVARVIQEQGRQGSDLVSGKSGYYNAFNIGASGNGKEQIVQNGIAYAQKKGWTTLELSIKGSTFLSLAIKVAEIIKFLCFSSSSS